MAFIGGEPSDEIRVEIDAATERVEEEFAAAIRAAVGGDDPEQEVVVLEEGIIYFRLSFYFNYSDNIPIISLFLACLNNNMNILFNNNF